MIDSPFMMQTPLLVSGLIEHAQRVYPNVAIYSRENDGEIHSTRYGEAGLRCRAVADALLKAGFTQGDCIGAFAWSTRRYLELFYSVPGIGAMLHTINPRLHTDDLSYIINDAGNKVLCIDRFTWPVVAEIFDHLKTVNHFIWLDDPKSIPKTHPFKNLLVYDNLVAQGDSGFVWPEFDENTPCTLCYTSGTTGKPKGVVYTHRGNVLLTLASSSQGFFGYPQSEGPGLSFLSLTGMFHGNAWMMPYAAPLLGARLALVGRDYDPQRLFELVDVAEVSLAAGVPTILQNMIDYALENERSFGSASKVVLAGSRPSKTLLETLEEQFSVETGQCWGMTEAQMGSSPVLKSEYKKLSASEKRDKKHR